MHCPKRVANDPDGVGEEVWGRALRVWADGPRNARFSFSEDLPYVMYKSKDFRRRMEQLAALTEGGDWWRTFTSLAVAARHSVDIAWATPQLRAGKFPANGLTRTSCFVALAAHKLAHGDGEGAVRELDDLPEGDWVGERRDWRSAMPGPTISCRR